MRLKPKESKKKKDRKKENKAGYTATPVACGRAGAIFQVTRAFEQEQYGQRIKNIKKS